MTSSDKFDALPTFKTCASKFYLAHLYFDHEIITTYLISYGHSVA